MSPISTWIRTLVTVCMDGNTFAHITYSESDAFRNDNHCVHNGHRLATNCLIASNFKTKWYARLRIL
ncbi:hypothetical protein EG68_04550 [Paragonimus skrjabini miyazakii]|uniref:Uncharacterized protein n=1 Tax=Paragonimus skrjabini miyazakii TaxID=59628 RepID=A0A8S9YTQ7_9TREM|nr:hypothetical protein EG68_04550 [Paragonimus skrjabini miyazakii]